MKKFKYLIKNKDTSSYQIRQWFEENTNISLKNWHFNHDGVYLYNHIHNEISYAPIESSYYLIFSTIGEEITLDAYTIGQKALCSDCGKIWYVCTYGGNGFWCWKDMRTKFKYVCNTAPAATDEIKDVAFNLNTTPFNCIKGYYLNNFNDCIVHNPFVDFMTIDKHGNVCNYKTTSLQNYILFTDINVTKYNFMMSNDGEFWIMGPHSNDYVYAIPYLDFKLW